MTCGSGSISSFFFSSRRRHTRCLSDWSSDVCSSDLSETQLRYLAVGTSESAKNVLSGAGDLGGGDAPIPEKQLKEAAYAAVELPTVLVGIAVFYNVPGGATSIRLSGPVLANIYLGKTTSWSDPEITRLNP